MSDKITWIENDAKYFLRRKFLRYLTWGGLGLGAFIIFERLFHPIRVIANPSRMKESSNLQAIDVREFGAKGNANHYNRLDGKYYEDQNYTIQASDDTVAIQSAINYLDFSSILYCTGNHLITKAIKIVNKETLTISGGKIIPWNFQNFALPSQHYQADYCFYLENCQYITLETIEFEFNDNSGLCSALLLKNCSDSQIVGCKLQANNDSQINSGFVVASNSKRILIENNQLSGGQRNIYNHNWERYRGFGLFVCGEDINITNNSCSGWALGGIKAGANRFLKDGEEVMSRNILIANNSLFDNSQQDIGATGICDTLKIISNICDSRSYEPNQKKWQRCNSIHLKSGLGAYVRKSKINNHRLINVLVDQNQCRSNIGVRSIDEIQNSSVYQGGENWIKNVVVSNNNINGIVMTGGQEQGISVRAAENIMVINNNILDTNSYPLSISGAYNVNIANNTISNSRTLAAYILMHDINTNDDSGRCYKIYIKDNIFLNYKEGSATDTVKFISFYEKTHDEIYFENNIDEKEGGFTYIGFNGTTLVETN